MKIISWNVNGVRAWYKKGSLEWVLSQSPDIFCLQEMKAHEEQLPNELREVPGFKLYIDHSKLKKGYSGVATYISNKLIDKVISVDTSLHVKNPSVLKSVQKVNDTAGPTDDIDHEGRFLAVHFEKFVLVNCYFPNGGGDSTRLEYKLNFYEAFLNYIKNLKNKGKSVIFCGDVNVAHTEIDIARPKENQNHVGFLPIERAWIDKVLESGFVDVYRKYNPDTTQVYTWWDLKTFARDRNVGWRIDYFFTDAEIFNKVQEIKIFNDVFGSDHCPLQLKINL
jgi:exodeoxyribonuclease-3